MSKENQFNFRGEEGHQYQEYYARSTSYYATSNVDLEKHLAATKPSFFLFIHMVSLSRQIYNQSFRNLTKQHEKWFVKEGKWID